MPESAQESGGFWRGVTEISGLSVTIMLLVVLALCAASFWQSSTENLPGRYIKLNENERGEHVRRWINGRLFVFRTDREGYVVPSAWHADPDLRIAFLGGSTTQCRGLLEVHRWPNLVADEVAEATGLKVDILNDSQANCTARDAFQLFYNKTQYHGPDVLVVSAGLNDMWTNFPAGSSVPRMVENLDLSHGSVYRMFLRAFEMGTEAFDPDTSQVDAPAEAVSPRPQMTFYSPPLSVFDGALRGLEEDLRLLASYARIKGIPVFFLTIPSAYVGEVPNAATEPMSSLAYQDGAVSFETMEKLAGRVNEVIRRVAREEPGAELVDVREVMPTDLEHFLDHVHFTAQGSRLVADLVSRKLVGWAKERGLRSPGSETAAPPWPPPAD